MDTKLQIFKNSEFGEMRGMFIDGEPWFIGKDVATILGYGKDNTKSKALANAISDHVDSEDKRLVSYQELKGYQNGDLKNLSHYGITFINESGVYSLIFGSTLPKAKEFKRWVTHNVLPAIRKTGGYIAGEENMTDEELVLKAMNVLTKKVDLLQLQVKEAEEQILSLKPKAEYTDMILATKGAIPITKIAKDYGMSGSAMNKTLKDLGVQYKMGETWLLTAKYQNSGYTKSQTVKITRRFGQPDTVIQTKWTQKGRMFIYELLKKNNILPLIEQEESEEAGVNE